MARMTLEEGHRRWEERARRLRGELPQSFRGAMAQVLFESRTAIGREVYGTPGRGVRSGDLKNREVMRITGESTAELANTATSEWDGQKVYYGWFVARGRRAGNKGQKYYAWMKRPSDPRPDTWAGWLEARNAGRAVLTHKTKAVSPRDWRKVALESIQRQGTIKVWLRRNTEKAMSS